MQTKGKATTIVAIVGGVIVMLIIILGSIWTGQSAKRDTETAVRTISMMYLNELASRREQVVESNLRNKIDTINIAIDLMTADDLSDKAHLEAYQRRMKLLYTLDKFAFVDTDGLIYTSSGYQTDIDSYDFDYKNSTLFFTNSVSR